MVASEYALYEDEELFELLFTMEDRLEKVAALEIMGRRSLASALAQVVMDKQNWLAELPEWWAVVHATYLLARRGGSEAVLPLLTAMRWADAFDCDWVTELMPAMLGTLGSPAIAGLTAVARDFTAGWSARDLALKSLAAISLHEPESTDHVFRIIGERFMDEGEDHLIRQLSGQILLDFRRADYRLALSGFAREDLVPAGLDVYYPAGFGPEDVDWTFRNPVAETWHYQEDWMRFYEPSEVQRRQKRWLRERLGAKRTPHEQLSEPGGGRVLPISRQGTSPEENEPEE
ncbi:MAG: hypothetical protein KQJ78_09580 [Deltaproteobacteria bacterium]|nr:hypothetical protein [Deltaproteobacteria bacterium]